MIHANSMRCAAFLCCLVLMLSSTAAAAAERKHNNKHKKVTFLEPEPVHLTHHCIHDQLQHPDFPPVAQQPSNSAKTKRATVWGNIRVLFDTSALDSTTDSYACYSASSGCLAADVLTSAKIAFLKETILKQAESWLELAYQVLQDGTPLTSNGNAGKCNVNGAEPLLVPASYTSPGAANTDLVLFVTARPMSSSGTIAVATSCSYDATGRPNMGHINFNPIYLDTSSYSEAQLPVKIKDMVATAVHEMHHAMGFSGLKLAGAGLTTTATFAGVSQTAVVGPKVLEYARTWFNCPQLTALPFENGGGTGTAGSHWEKRVFMNEFITGTIGLNPLISGFTMALMEDTTWYKANYSCAANTQYTWGKDAGCAFVNSSCLPHSLGKGFCNVQKYGCTADRMSGGMCQISTYTSALPAANRYFSNSLLGGSDSLADYCPYYVPVTNADCRYGSDNAPDGYNYGTEVCSDGQCRCFESTLISAEMTKQVTGGCHRWLCVGPQKLKLRVNGIWYNCPYDSEIETIGYNGTLKCPSTEEDWCWTATGGSNVTDDSWPQIIDIVPRSGVPGVTVVVIKGRNFRAPMMFNFGGINATDITVYNSTYATCKMGSLTLSLSTLKIIALDELTYVLATDTLGRTDVVMSSFVVQNTLVSDNLLKQLGQWIKDNVLLFCLIVVACLAVLLVASVLVIRHRIKARNKVTDQAIAKEKVKDMAKLEAIAKKNKKKQQLQMKQMKVKGTKNKQIRPTNDNQLV